MRFFTNIENASRVVIVLFISQLLACPIPLKSETSCPEAIIQMYMEILGTLGTDNNDLKAFLSSLPSEIIPLSLPMKGGDTTTITLPALNSQEYCDHHFLSLYSPLPSPSSSSSFSLSACHFKDHCICQVSSSSTPAATPAITSTTKTFDVIVISSTAFDKNGEIVNLLSQVNKNRKLELVPLQTDHIATPMNATSSGDKFDIGVVTHAVLVVLSLISFAGNALFVVYVFWLSR